MPDRKFPEAPKIILHSLADFDAAIARIVEIEAQQRDAVIELELEALLEAADLYIRQHKPKHVSDEWRERLKDRDI